ncbi:Lipopolysaccharide-induced tumor necrosis factor-alpha factor-like [Oopsacas minuta]|uniref:Lipopolysaccharide-induced tumor necrosis factor-alpha factor-like n=1 Tax=Oopsacas minuta TaxID=111878 RepID=A0AAV7JUY5_9METZ|nr:Lipopolysaccharide-induced tumor necrosis factor-alpha factor-like [Oopsacas minuta]
MSQQRNQVPRGYERGPPPNYTSVMPTGNEYGSLVEQIGHNPQHITCPNCRVTQISKIQREIGPGALRCTLIMYIAVICTLIFILPVLIVPFFCVPLCMNRYKQTEHVCPSCNHIIGVCRMKIK